MRFIIWAFYHPIWCLVRPHLFYRKRLKNRAKRRMGGGHLVECLRCEETRGPFWRMS